MKKIKLVLIPLLALLFTSCNESRSGIYPTSKLPLSYYVSPDNFRTYESISKANLHYQFNTTKEIVHYTYVTLRFSYGYEYVAVSGHEDRTFYLPIIVLDNNSWIINYFVWFSYSSYCPICGKINVK